MITNLEFTFEDMMEMLKRMDKDGYTAEQMACIWLQENDDVWLKWMRPSKNNHELLVPSMYLFLLIMVYISIPLMPWGFGMDWAQFGVMSMLWIPRMWQCIIAKPLACLKRCKKTQDEDAIDAPTVTFVPTEPLEGGICFASHRFLCHEDEESVQIWLMRSEDVEFAAEVKVATRDGSAKAGNRYVVCMHQTNRHIAS